MKTSRIIVRLDEASLTAELEIMAPHEKPRPSGLEATLGRHGIRTLRTVELLTPRHRVTRMRLAERDGSELQQGRVMQILNLAQQKELLQLQCFYAA